MPFFIVNTNAELRTKNAQDFVEDAAKLIAQELHKPINYVVVQYNYNPHMSFGGYQDNYGALAELKSIGLPETTNLAKLLTEFLYDRLSNVELNNINIEFINMPVSTLAIGGRMMG